MRRIHPSLNVPRFGHGPCPRLQRTLFTRSSPTPTSPYTAGAYAAATTIALGAFAAYYFDARAALHRYLVTPALRKCFDAETGHKIALRVLRSGLAPRDPVKDDARLEATIWGETLGNPIGLAAGFDKDGEAIDGLFNLGFSWVEIGSVTPKPQPGNPRPRVFHLDSDNALINRYGFPSQGHAAVLARLRERPPHPRTVLAVNLGKNKTSPAESIADFVEGVRVFAPYADVLVVNVSSPNTPGLRGLQTRALLEELLQGVTQARAEAATANSTARKPKLLLKVAPDLSEHELHDIARAVTKADIDGVIVSNTTTARPPSLTHPNRGELGGLSGPPLKPLALAALRTLRAALPADVPLVGCGGISSGADALEYARAGASLVQVYTAFGYDGPGAARRIKDELVALLAKEGTTWAAEVKKARGKGARGNVDMLVKEAEELHRLVDELALRRTGSPYQGGA